MTIQDFVSQHNGKGLDFDGAYGNQCVDLAQFWSQAIGGPVFTGNAKDIAGQTHGFYQWVPNTPAGVPQPGDIIVWDTRIGPYGHIAVVVDANANSFDSFDQNWNYHPFCEVIHHTYFGVAGWLHRDQPAPQPTNQGDEDMIKPEDRDDVRVVGSEIKGWDFNQVHSGELDAREMAAWVGHPWTQLIGEGWQQSGAYREKRQAALAYYDQKNANDAALSGANDKIGLLTAQVENLQKQLASPAAPAPTPEPPAPVEPAPPPSPGPVSVPPTPSRPSWLQRLLSWLKS